MEFTGVEEFEVTVEAGETVYCNLYRVFGKELTVASETVKILYGEQEYMPVEGVVTCLVNVADPSTPALVAFTNTGSAAETYKVTLVPAEGSMEKPYELQLEDFVVDVAEGNSQGVFYTYTAQKAGRLTITVEKAPADVKYGIALNNITASKYMTLEENGVKNDDGDMTLTVEAEKNNELQLVVTVQPDETGKYPAATFELEADFETDEQTSGNGGSGGSNGGSSDNYNGKLVNADDPQIEWGLNDFSVEVGAGEKKLVHIGRVVTEGTLCIYDSSAYVVYDGKTYTPNSSGNIFILIEAQRGQDILEMEIGNSGSSDKNYDILFYFAKGTRENPNELTLGENNVELEAGNDQGCFYTYKASSAGTLTLEVKSISPDHLVCKISISDMQTIPTVVELEEGSTVVSIELPAGAKAEIVFSAKDPNKEWKIPAADVVIEASFQ